MKTAYGRICGGGVDTGVTQVRVNVVEPCGGQVGKWDGDFDLTPAFDFRLVGYRCSLRLSGGGAGVIVVRSFDTKVGTFVGIGAPPDELRDVMPRSAGR